MYAADRASVYCCCVLPAVGFRDRGVVKCGFFLSRLVGAPNTHAHGVGVGQPISPQEQRNRESSERQCFDHFLTSVIFGRSVSAVSPKSTSFPRQSRKDAPRVHVPTDRAAVQNGSVSEKSNTHKTEQMSRKTDLTVGCP